MCFPPHPWEFLSSEVIQGKNYDKQRGENDNKFRKNKTVYKKGNLIVVSYMAQLKILIQFK